MTLTIELLPDPAANDLRLAQLAAQRSSPIDRLNILHGSALQRLAAQRMLAEANGGAVAAVYGFTPVDLAQAAAQLGDPPKRQIWPAGADLATLRRVVATLPLNRLDPDAPGVASALLRTLTDLREAALDPDVLDDGDLKTIFAAWSEVVSSSADRTSRYEDAISSATPDSAYREALGDAPLIVSGIYDLTRIQRLLLARLSLAADVRMLLVAPSDDPASPAQRTLAALRRELNPRVIRSLIPVLPLAPDSYFSVGDPTAEADEIASRILQLGRNGVAFHRIAILHQQGSAADDRICAALERADIPSWRIGGRQLLHTPPGRAALSLAQILLDPESVERTALLDWLSHRSLNDRPLDIERSPAQWDRAALDAGLTRGLHQMSDRLDGWIASTHANAGAGLERLVGDLSRRSLQLEEYDNWDLAVDLLLRTIDDYLDDRNCEPELLTAVRDTFAQLRAHDTLTVDWSPSDGLTALKRAFSSRVVREPRRLIGGVNVGAATGPARGIRYDAVFIAGAAERVFPAVGRQDPLLTDRERTAINARIPDALALQGDRADSDRHAWALARRAAAQQFCASWSRRSSAVGGPARPSSLLLESAATDPTAASETALSAIGRIERIETALVTAAPSESAVESADWSSILQTPDDASLRVGLLTAPNVDTADLLPRIWPEATPADTARRRRNAASFTEFDGLLDHNALTDHWRPLDHTWTASALETYVTCPYRFFLRHVVGIHAEPDAGRAEQTEREHGRLIKRVLSSWVREYEHFKADRTWFEYANSPSYLHTVAHRILDSAGESGALGPPAGVPAARREILNDLDRVRRREAADARDGWRPLEVNAAFDDAPLRVTGDRQLRLQGIIDRIDIHAGGRQRALSFFSGRTFPDVRGFVNGSSFASVAALAALTQRGVPIDQAEVEHRSVTSRGSFESQTLAGESLTSTGGRSAPSDGERLRDALATIADQLQAANFVPYPGNPPRDRPNCARCPVESSCTADIGRRYAEKARRNQEVVRPLEVLRRQRV